MRCVSRTVRSGWSSECCSTTPIRSRSARGAAPGSWPRTVAVAAVTAPVALEDLDRGRLARAVRSEQAEDLALGYLEADPSERLDAAVGLREVGDDDGVGHGPRRYAPRRAWVGWPACRRCATWWSTSSRTPRSPGTSLPSSRTRARSSLRLMQALAASRSASPRPPSCCPAQDGGQGADPDLQPSPRDVLCRPSDSRHCLGTVATSPARGDRPRDRHGDRPRRDRARRVRCARVRSDGGSLFRRFVRSTRPRRSSRPSAWRIGLPVELLRQRRDAHRRDARERRRCRRALAGLVGGSPVSTSPA